MGRNGEQEYVINISRNCSSSSVYATNLFYIGFVCNHWNLYAVYVERKNNGYSKI